MTESMMDILMTTRDALLSMDGGAQAKTLEEMVTGVHPRHFLMEPVFVPLGIVLYLVLKVVMQKICRSAKTTGTSMAFRAFALLHNVLLCAFSFWTTTNVWSMTAKYLQQSVEGVYCDSDLWDAGLSYFGFIFYLSKYWELVDTFLLIWKQKEASYLQVYHHAVTILCAYMLQVSHSRVTFLFVGLNSFVHTVMYAYFALTVIGVRFRAKNLITIMQMVQFLLGICLAAPTFWLRGGECATVSQKVAVVGILLHAAYLMILFAQFYIKSYSGKTKAKTQ